MDRYRLFLESLEKLSDETISEILPEDWTREDLEEAITPGNCRVHGTDASASGINPGDTVDWIIDAASQL